MVRALFGLVLGVAIAGCAEAASDVPEYVPLPPANHASPACGAGEVALRGACLDCDAARAEVTRLLSEQIAALGWGRCRTDSDCVSQVWATACDGQCNVAIGGGSVVAFEAALPNFTASVCDAATWEPVCGAPLGLDCASGTACIGGSCQICAACDR